MRSIDSKPLLSAHRVERDEVAARFAVQWPGPGRWPTGDWLRGLAIVRSTTGAGAGPAGGRIVRGTPHSSLIAPDPPGQIDGQLDLLDQDSDRETAQAALAAPSPVTAGRPPGIQKVWLKRFKQFDDFTLDLGRFNVLVGPNNSGKSTLLQTIDLLYSLLKLLRDGEHLAPAGRYVPPGVLPVASIKDLFWRRQTRSGNENISVVIGADFADGSSVEFGIRHLFGNMNARVIRHNGIDGDRLSELIGHRAVWVPSSVGIVPDEEYRTAARRTSMIFAGRHNEVLRNLLVQLKDTNPEGSIACSRSSSNDLELVWRLWVSMRRRTSMSARILPPAPTYATTSIPLGRALSKWYSYLPLSWHSLQALCSWMSRTLTCIRAFSGRSSRSSTTSVVTMDIRS